jgi:hypothetical protein
MLEVASAWLSCSLVVVRALRRLQLQLVVGLAFQHEHFIRRTAQSETKSSCAALFV